MAIESIISEISLDVYDHDRTQPTLKAIRSSDTYGLPCIYQVGHIPSMMKTQL